MEKGQGIWASLLSAIMPLIFIWLSLVLPLTFSESSGMTEPLGVISRHIVWLIAMYYSLSYDEFVEVCRVAGFGSEVPKEYWESFHNAFKLSGFIAMRALSHSEQICRRIPLLTRCSSYEPPLNKVTDKVVKTQRGIRDGIIDGLHLATSPLAIIGVSALVFIAGLEMIIRGKMIGFLFILWPGIWVLYPLFAIFIYGLILIVILLGVIAGFELNYFIALLITLLISLIGTWKLLIWMWDDFPGLPKVLREPFAGAILGTVAGSIVADLVHPTTGIPFWALGATIGTILGILTTSFEGFFVALASLFTSIFTNAVGGAASHLINAISGAIQGLAIRIVLSLWQGGEVGVQDILRNIREDIPSIIAYGVIGGIIGAFLGARRAVKAIKIEEIEKGETP